MARNTFLTICNSVSATDPASVLRMRSLMHAPLQTVGLSLEAHDALISQGIYTVEQFASKYNTRMSKLIDVSLRAEVNHAFDTLRDAVSEAYGRWSV